MVLLNELKPEECSHDMLQMLDLRLREHAEVLQNADRIRCFKYLTLASIVAGNPRPSLAFTVDRFNTRFRLARLEEAEVGDYGRIEDFNLECER